MMKNITNKILLGLGLLASVACTKIDNYDGPNASLEGRLIDTETGENFQTAPGNIQVRIFQVSWSATPSPQDIPSKVDGTFKDTKLFSGRYKAIPVGGAFWPVLDTAEFDIKSGSKMDFELTPYIVIKNLTHELDGNDLTLRFDIDVPLAGIPTIIDAQPYINTTKIVGPGPLFLITLMLLKLVSTKSGAI